MSHPALLSSARPCRLLPHQESRALRCPPPRQQVASAPLPLRRPSPHPCGGPGDRLGPSSRRAAWTAQALRMGWAGGREAGGREVGSLLLRAGRNVAPAAKLRERQTEMPAARWGRGRPPLFPLVSAQGHSPCPVLELRAETWAAHEGTGGWARGSRCPQHTVGSRHRARAPGPAGVGPVPLPPRSRRLPGLGIPSCSQH